MKLTIELKQEGTVYRSSHGSRDFTEFSKNMLLRSESPRATTGRLSKPSTSKMAVPEERRERFMEKVNKQNEAWLKEDLIKD